MIGKTYGNYRIEQQIGEGGMGVLYRATDLTTRRPVAMKFIRPYLASDPQFQQRFIQEARAIAALDHPNIVRVLHISTGQGPLFIVMEHIDGGSLRDYQKWLYRQQKAIEINDAIRLTQQIADALHYAHRINMVHRDVKPDNVLLRLAPNGTIQQAILTDFGLAGLAATVSTTGAPKGTFAYMSPEQCRGERVDGRSDIYSLGIMLYELVTGRLPFDPTNLNDAIRMHTSAPVPPPSQVRPNIPQVLEQIILKALAKNPNERFQNASAMAQALLGASAPGALAQPAQPAQPLGLRTEYGSPPAPMAAPNYDNPPVAAGDAGKLRLVYGRTGQAANFAWIDAAVLMVGREAGNNIALDSVQVSRQHARIDRGNDGRIRITDLGSSNGTFLGNMRLTPNTPYEWRPGQIVRIGEFWVKLETAVATPQQPAQAGGQPLIVPVGGVAPGVPQPMNSAAFSMVQPVAPAANTPQETTQRIGVKLLADVISVQAGGRSIITVEVYNQGSLTDHFSAEVRGLPPEWYTLPTEAVQLRTNERNNLLISLHPPRNSRSTAGVHSYDVLIRSRAAPNEYVTRPGKLQIEPFYGLETAVYPKRLRQMGAFDVSVTNTGNAQENYSVTASDPEQSLDMVIDRAQVQVPPGQTEKILVRVRPRTRALVGQTKTIPVSMAIKSLRPEGEQQSQTAEFVNGPLMPTWLISSATLLFTLCIMLGGFAFLMRRASDLANQDTGNVAATQGAIASQTAAAAADDDLDGLSNIQERQLGTQPGDNDTDDDGLNDGDEVNQFSSNPRNRDTDNDTIPDGEEVNRGLSPTLRDTDGDGVPDGVDTAPGATSTTAPTITPTVPPTPTAPPIPSPTTAPTLTPIPTATPTLTFTPTHTPTFTPTPVPDIAIQPASIPPLSDVIGDGIDGPAVGFVISNTGGSPLTITSITTINNVFAVIPPAGASYPFTLAPGQSTNQLFTPNNFSVVLNTNQASNNGSLVINSNDPNTPALVLPLTGNGTVANGNIEILSGSPPLNFADSNGTDNLAVTPQSVTIENRGNVPVTLSFVFAGDTLNEFSAVLSATSLAPGPPNTVTVTITYNGKEGAPVNTSNRNVTLNITSTYASATLDTLAIALVGSIAQPNLSFAFTVNSLDVQILGPTTTSTSTVTITNNGGFTVTLTGASFDNGQFTIDPILPPTLIPTQPVTLTVHYAPGSNLDPVSSTLSVITNIPVATSTLVVTAQGSASRIVDPGGRFADVNFGAIADCNAVTRDIILENSGNRNLSGTVSIDTTTSSPRLRLLDDLNNEVVSVAFDVASGNTTVIRMQYRPSFGSATANVDIIHNDPLFPENPIEINFAAAGLLLTCS